MSKLLDSGFPGEADARVVNAPGADVRPELPDDSLDPWLGSLGSGLQVDA
ncbi:hypothetical protein [Micromonospora sp. B9E7]